MIMSFYPMNEKLYSKNSRDEVRSTSFSCRETGTLSWLCLFEDYGRYCKVWAIFGDLVWCVLMVLWVRSWLAVGRLGTDASLQA